MNVLYPMDGSRVMAKRPIPNTSWGGGCGDKKIIGTALVLTLCAMLLNMRAMWRYVRHGDMP